MKAYYKKLYNLFFMLSILSFAFFSQYKAPFAISLWGREILVFFILISISFVFLILDQKKIEIDIWFLGILVVRELGLFLAAVTTKTTLAVSYSSFFSAFAIFLVWTIVKYIDKRALLTSILLISILASIEFIIVVVFKKTVDKNYIVSSIGGSNYAATFLLLALILLINLKLTKTRIACMGIILIGFLLTKSFGCYLALAIGIILSAIFNKKSLPRIIKWWQYLILIGCMVVVGFIFKNKFMAFFYELSRKLGYLFSGNFNDFGSSRNILYEFTIKNILNHPWIGPLLNYDKEMALDFRFQYFMSHNFILESFVRYGTWGTILNVCLCVHVVKVIEERRKVAFSRFDKAIVLAIHAGLCHGLIEPNLFTIRYDIIFFSLLGFLARYTIGNSKEILTPYLRIESDIKNVIYIDSALAPQISKHQMGVYRARYQSMN